MRISNAGGGFLKQYEESIKSKRLEYFEWLESVVWAVVWLVVLFCLVARVATVSGISMQPSLENGDVLLVTGAWYFPKQGDIVVITQAQNPDEPLIKRVIAIEGQTVDIDSSTGAVLVDGQVLEEPYVKEAIQKQPELTFPQTVPEGRLFVLGDNRNHSLDSRAYQVGMVDSRYVLGKVRLRIYPFDRMGLLNG